MSKPIPHPSVWGPHFWYVIHTYSDTYPEQPNVVDVEVASQFIKILPFLLPCNECAKHAFDYIKPFVEDEQMLKNIVKNKESLSSFFHNFHNTVNIRTGKPVFHK